MIELWSIFPKPQETASLKQVPREGRAKPQLPAVVPDAALLGACESGNRMKADAFSAGRLWKHPIREAAQAPSESIEYSCLPKRDLFCLKNSSRQLVSATC